MLDKMQELQGSQDLAKSFALLLFNASYNEHREQDVQISDQDVFKAKNMETFCDSVE